MSVLKRGSLPPLALAALLQWYALGERVLNGIVGWWKLGTFHVDGGITMLLAFLVGSGLLALFGVWLTYSTPSEDEAWRWSAGIITSAIVLGGLLWPTLLFSPFGQIVMR